MKIEIWANKDGARHVTVIAGGLERDLDEGEVDALIAALVKWRGTEAPDSHDIEIVNADPGEVQIRDFDGLHTILSADDAIALGRALIHAGTRAKERP